MDNTTRVVIIFAVLAALVSSGESFWYSSSSSGSGNHNLKKASNGGQWQGPPHPGVYSVRSEPYHPFPPHIQHGQLQFDANGQPQFVALPLAVPIPAQLHPQMSQPSPMTVQNVQLVPCLCPIAKDVEYPLPSPTPSSAFMAHSASMNNNNNNNNHDNSNSHSNN